MKKKLLTGLLAIGFAMGLTAQSAAKLDLKTADRDNTDEDCIHKGVNTVNIYYGVSLLNSIYKGVASASALDVDFKALGPIGIVYEHLMTDKVGLGVEVGYTSFSMTYNESETGPNGNAYYAHANWKWTVLRAQARVNFHLVRSAHFDTYILISAGYRKTDFTVSWDDPYNNNHGSSGFTIPIPIGIKPGLGVRYFFGDHFGLNLEIAAGTPVLGGGVSLRF